MVRSSLRERGRGDAAGWRISRHESWRVIRHRSSRQSRSLRAQPGSLLSDLTDHPRPRFPARPEPAGGDQILQVAVRGRTARFRAATRGWRSSRSPGTVRRHGGRSRRSLGPPFPCRCRSRRGSGPSRAGAATRPIDLVNLLHGSAMAISRSAGLPTLRRHRGDAHRR